MLVALVDARRGAVRGLDRRGRPARWAPGLSQTRQSPPDTSPRLPWAADAATAGSADALSGPILRDYVAAQGRRFCGMSRRPCSAQGFSVAWCWRQTCGRNDLYFDYRGYSGPPRGSDGAVGLASVSNVDAGDHVAVPIRVSFKRSSSRPPRRFAHVRAFWRARRVAPNPSGSCLQVSNTRRENRNAQE